MPPCRAGPAECHPAHHVVRRGHHFDKAAGEIEAAICATLYHALEVPAVVVGTQMRHADVDAAIGSSAPRSHLRKNSTRHDVARGALELRVVIAHEPLGIAIE